MARSASTTSSATPSDRSAMVPLAQISLGWKALLRKSKAPGAHLETLDRLLSDGTFLGDVPNHPSGVYFRRKKSKAHISLISLDQMDALARAFIDATGAQPPTFSDKRVKGMVATPKATKVELVSFQGWKQGTGGYKRSDLVCPTSVSTEIVLPAIASVVAPAPSSPISVQRTTPSSISPQLNLLASVYNEAKVGKASAVVIALDFEKVEAGWTILTFIPENSGDDVAEARRSSARAHVRKKTTHLSVLIDRPAGISKKSFMRLKRRARKTSLHGDPVPQTSPQLYETLVNLLTTHSRQETQHLIEKKFKDYAVNLLERTAGVFVVDTQVLYKEAKHESVARKLKDCYSSYELP
ncbi:hypothetical protein MNV49_002661 [Pseudohyphozyma bogoriensis]|nr:hypothetical protein MNV49_002661 [Pseudohyphozyma bogoriensis]